MQFTTIEQFAPDWWAMALCLGRGNDIFFGDDESQASLREARVHCGDCPAARDCLRHALTTPEEYGIWAGTSARNRAKMVSAIESGKDVDVIVEHVIENDFRWKNE